MKALVLLYVFLYPCVCVYVLCVCVSMCAGSQKENIAFAAFFDL
jgi:hypothetical protein